ncbi:MAG: AMP-binding protein [Actinobacteria bacterium]|nr:AMP-binding protein [Actinomycetota bacterium]
MNFAGEILGALEPEGRAMVELSREGRRREWSFGETLASSGLVAGTLASRGVRRGDVVMTLIGNRPEWVFSLLACWRIGAVALPCTEQLRAKDLAARVEATEPALIVADERNRGELEAALGHGDVPVLLFPDEDLYGGGIEPPSAELDPTDPALVTFTSGTSGEPKPVLHGQRYLFGQRLQAEYWMAPEPGDLVWCTAASGWSKSARNAFVAPWLRGAAALLQDARFDPEERLATIESERVDVLCMAPTEYRVIVKRAELRPLPALRGCVAAGEALNPEVLSAWQAATGHDIRDGYGQTETGQITANPPGRPTRPGSMGLALPGIEVWIEDGELALDPRTVPTFFLGYGSSRGEEDRVYRTGDRVRIDEDGYLYFEGRTDDVIISSGYRIGPFEVESALVAHPAVAEAAVVAYPDPERGSVVRAVVVLRDEGAARDDLVRELQDHVKATTAPYKYPRIVEFATALPKTSSGKVKRAELREVGPSNGDENDR